MKAARAPKVASAMSARAKQVVTGAAYRYSHNE